MGKNKPGALSGLLIASLSFCYEPEEVGFFGRWLKKPSLNAEIETRIQALESVLADCSDLSGVVLPKFCLIGLADVKVWITNYVEPNCDCDAAEVEERAEYLFRDDEYLPIERVAAELKKILKECHSD